MSGQEASLAEQREGKVPIIAKQLDEGVVPVIDLQDDSFEELDVIFHSLPLSLSLTPLDIKSFKKILVQAGLWEDISKTVGLTGIGKNKVEKFKHNHMAHLPSLAPKQFLNDLVLAQRPDYLYNYIKHSSSSGFILM